jgi:hypothetical protein
MWWSSEQRRLLDSNGSENKLRDGVLIKLWTHDALSVSLPGVKKRWKPGGSLDNKGLIASWACGATHRM